MNALPLVIGVGAAIGAYLLTIGVIASRAADATALARERLARQEVGLGQSAVALQLEKPFTQRLFGPMRRWLDRQMLRLTPEAQAANFRRQLDFAGNPLNLDPASLQTLRIAAAAAFGAIGTAIGMFLGTPFAIGIALLGGVAVGFYLPVLWLDQLVRGILYAERTGVPIARTIAAHAAQMRVKRRLKIRTEAARASLKILLPTVGCVFPTLWLVLLGPALIVVLTLGH